LVNNLGDIRMKFYDVRCSVLELEHALSIMWRLGKTNWAIAGKRKDKKYE